MQESIGTTSKVFADERKQLIVEMVNRDRKKSVEDLCQYFSVSPTTMRNDLRDLEAMGLLKRTHGGAISKKKMTFEPTNLEKVVDYIEQKRAIAKIAASYIQDNDVIILDTGSTVLELAKCLDDKQGLTVITYDFGIANYLETHSDATIVFLGGVVRRNFHCAMGPMTIAAVKDLNADRAFMGFNGINLKKGLSTPNMEIATIKKEMIRISDEIIMLGDSSKVEKSSFAKFADLDQVDLLITDDELSQEQYNQYREAGVDVETPSRASNNL